MTEDVLPTVKDSSSLLRVQLVDEVSGEVLIAVLISKIHTHTHITRATGQLKDSLK